MASHTDAGGRTVLVTGIGGFTGCYLAAALKAAGYFVVGTGHAREAAVGDRFVAADLLDGAAIARLVAEIRPTHVLHLAAISFVAHGDFAEIYRTNIVGTRNLLDALAAVGGQTRIVLASSGNIYGNAQRLPISEGTPPSAVNDYAVSKIAMEHLADMFADRLDIMIARPFNYTGRGQSQRFLVPKIVDAFRRRTAELALGNLDISRDFSDVRDVAAAYVGLLGLQGGGRVNLCSGTDTRLRDILDICTQATGHRPEIRVNLELVRANDVVRLVGDNSRLKSMLPSWSPRPFPETLNWMLADRGS